MAWFIPVRHTSSDVRVPLHTFISLKLMNLFSVETDRDSVICEICQFYLRLWSSQFGEGNVNEQVAIQSCRSLKSILKGQKSVRSDNLSNIQILSRTLYQHYFRRFFSVTLLGEDDDAVIYSNFSAYVLAINSFVQSFNVSTTFILCILMNTVTNNVHRQVSFPGWIASQTFPTS